MRYNYETVSGIMQYLTEEHGGYSELIKAKIDLWESATGLKFDKDGRAVLGKWAPTLGEEELSKHFKNVMNFSASCLSYEPYLVSVMLRKKVITERQAALLSVLAGWLYTLILVGDNCRTALSTPVGFEPTTEDVFFTLRLPNEGGFKPYLDVSNGGKVTSYKFMGLLEEADKLWREGSVEGRKVTFYSNLEKIYRKAGHSLSDSVALRDAKENKEYYIRPSVWYQWDSFLNKLGKAREDDIVLSLNPLDHLVMAGDSNKTDDRVIPEGDPLDYYTSYSPTLFRTCWGVSMHRDSGDVTFRREGEYANLRAMVNFGAIYEKATLYVRNSQAPVTIDTVDGDTLKLYGVKFRCHSYLVDGKVFCDNMYPSNLTGFKDRVKELMRDAYLGRAEFSKKAAAQGLSRGYRDWQAEALRWNVTNAEAFRDDLENGDELFLDSVAVDTYSEEFFVFKLKGFSRSPRIELGYDGAFDMSPLENAGIAGENGRYIGDCHSCGDRLYGDDYIQLENGNLYCDHDCAENDGYRMCDGCGDWEHIDCMVESHRTGDLYCNTDCAEYHEGHSCEHCGETRDNTVIAIDRYGYEIHFCNDDCAGYEGYYRCETCDDLVHEDSCCPRPDCEEAM